MSTEEDLNLADAPSEEINLTQPESEDPNLAEANEKVEEIQEIASKKSTLKTPPASQKSTLKTQPPSTKSSIKIPPDIENLEQPSRQSVIDSITHLFKVSLKIEDLSGKKLESSEFEASFLFLPTITFKPYEAKGIIFPMNKNDFVKFQAPTLILSAIFDGHTIATADVDISREFDKLEEEYESFPDSFPVQKTEPITFSNDRGKIGEATFTVQFICLGQSKIESSAPLVQTPAKSEEPCEVPALCHDDGDNKSLCEEKEHDFDEYFADINGNALKIKILRKKGVEEVGVCDCEGTGKQLIPGGGIGRKGSQVIFQMPNKMDLCTKNPPNAISYNVGNCLKQIEHDHGTDKMRINAGKSNATPGNQKVDKFLLKIGKKDVSADSRGRVEVELCTPKLLSAEDFKKPCQSKTVQTEDDRGKKKR